MRKEHPIAAKVMDCAANIERRTVVFTEHIELSSLVSFQTSIMGSLNRITSDDGSNTNDNGQYRLDFENVGKDVETSGFTHQSPGGGHIPPGVFEGQVRWRPNGGDLFEHMDVSLLDPRGVRQRLTFNASDTVTLTEPVMEKGKQVVEDGASKVRQETYVQVEVTASADDVDTHGTTELTANKVAAQLFGLFERVAHEKCGPEFP